jgi:hypothetical protein
MAKTTASRKAKGRRLQNHVVKVLLEKFPMLTESDVRSTPMGCTGEDVWLSEAARVTFPYAVEAKNTERLNIWAALKQAETERKGTPLVVFSKNHAKIYCAMEFDHFMDLIEELEELRLNKDLEEINAES